MTPKVNLLTIDAPAVFKPLDQPSRVLIRGASENRLQRPREVARHPFPNSFTGKNSHTRSTGTGPNQPGTDILGWLSTNGDCPSMNQTLTIEAPAVFKPLDQPSRYKGLHGGRGSGKSWHAATMLVLRCLKEPGIRVVCAREIQKTLAESAKRLIEDRIASLSVGHMFRVQHDRILTPGDAGAWPTRTRNQSSPWRR
jgi:Phage terminase large subunit